MPQPIGVSPMVNFVFKLLLGSPEQAAVTIHFLRAILGERFQIRSVEFQNPDLGKTYDDDKWIILDILVTDDHGRQYNIEMQTSIPAGLRQRLAFYLSRLYASQLKDGEQNRNLWKR
jgi:predicted transposase/invertase (TIGR01784 family)